MLAGCLEPRPVFFGFAGQFSGPAGDVGAQGRNGATLAVEDINAAGGVGGRPLRLLAADDGDTPEGAVLADQQLAGAGVVAIVGHMSSRQTLAALPETQRLGLVLVSPVTSSPLLAGLRDNFFRVVTDAASVARPLADYAVGTMGLRRFVLLHDEDNPGYTESFNTAFAERLAERGAEEAGQLAFSARAGADWAALVPQVLQSGADAVLVSALAVDVAGFAKALRAAEPAGRRLTILCPGGISSRELVIAGGQAVEGLIAVSGYAEDNPAPRFVDFKTRYIRRFGWPPNFAAAYAYDATLLLAQALRITGGKAAGLGRALVNTGVIHGVLGDFSLDPCGDVFRPVVIQTVRNGVMTTLTTVE